MNRNRAMLLPALLALLLLAGCTTQMEERPMEDLSSAVYRVDAAAPQQDQYEAQTENVLLYFLDKDGVTLRPIAREIAAEGGMSRMEAALRALLDGPVPGEDDVFWPDMGSPNAVRRMELSDGIAVVDLPSRVRELPPDQLYAVRQAVANTLTEFPEVHYVNVLVGGREEGLDLAAQLPVGTLTRVDDPDTGAVYARLADQRQAGSGLTKLTTLYFPSEDGRYLLPQVRQVAYAGAAPIEYLYQILEELGRGAGREAQGGVPAPLKYITKMPEIIRTADGSYRAIEICFDAGLDAALAGAGLTRGVYTGMLTDTLMGFVPGVEGLQISIGQELVDELDAAQTPDGAEIAFEHALATRPAFAAYTGAPVTLYLPAEDGKHLVRTACIVAQGEQYDVRARLAGLMHVSESEGLAVLPAGLTDADVLAVYAGRREIVLNLSSGFASSLGALSPREQRMAVFSVVNTLTEGMSAQRVYFFFEGKQLEEISGEIDMRGYFVRNPGMVVE